MVHSPNSNFFKDSPIKRVNFAGNHFPTHYDARSLNFEEILEGLDVNLEDFYYASVVKYLYRYPFKGRPTEDLVKARSYLDLLIEVKRIHDQEQHNKEA